MDYDGFKTIYIELLVPTIWDNKKSEWIMIFRFPNGELGKITGKSSKEVEDKWKNEFFINYGMF